MSRALRIVRGLPAGRPAVSINLAGFVKYSLCTIAALACLLLPIALPYRFVLGIVGFYAVEAQLVFLFPLLLEGELAPWRRSVALTQRAGGTVSVMLTILPIAASMIFGGFIGKGFVRSWCIGCLAVVLWYATLNPR